MILQGDKLSPNWKNIFAHFFCSRELLVELASLHRKYVTQKENKGTLCPPTPPPGEHLGFFWQEAKNLLFCSCYHKRKHRTRKISSIPMPPMMVSTMAAIRWDVENPWAIFKVSCATPLRSPLPIWLKDFQHGGELLENHTSHSVSTIRRAFK